MAEDEQSHHKIDLDNPELQQALQIVKFTRKSLFLTGKAGTGKSTFLRYIANTTKKKHIVLAPTGIAAINAGGNTLHSFFKIPFFPLLPSDQRYTPRNIRKTLKYNSEKIKLIREVELIIIDEISMVRSDIIDFIDKVLRVYSNNMREAFGGKQLLFVGDLYQLEPVLKEEERQLLHPFYPSSYFFDAIVFRSFKLVSIELRKVYRQSDQQFISILDRIRINQATSRDLQLINQRVDKSASSQKDDKDISITLSLRRDTVDYINNEELKKLPYEFTTFFGIVKGEFPENALPTPMELELKVGAHVMFIKNDIQHRWVNGTLGIIVAIDEEEQKICIQTEDGQEYDIEQDLWENTRYTFNEKEKKIEEELLGTYKQFPIRLAWAITVHKSQGLTFSNVNIDFGSGAFAGGQTYVALSRCKSLEGITLRESIHPKDIFVRQEVVNFAQQYNNDTLISNALKESKADKAYYDAVKAFDRGDFDALLKHFFTAIHSRYDIETPLAKRFIRKKLNIIHQLQTENKVLKAEKQKQDEFLKELSVEYVIMGRDCEKEGFNDAAIKNYEKALKLCPNNPVARKKLNSLKK